MTPSELEKLITNIVHGDNPSTDRVVTLPESDLDKTFDQLDVDSLARAEMVETISDTYRIEISDVQAGVLDTPRAVLEFVTAHETRTGQ
ncbi:hypothetical protein GCM10010387_17270 [Streptomyces inusitatus]|uniref:Carrier domain-containing protein n=1 Tax=Streptomyces inusitatus TaxID=68221 RepID=A0A918UPB6_9ACTN|nr:phosphopantetheine-binding protein [Streptomyces inusitatus]GGZ24430.1 hypothetical protein GCM10010387_17270 [Streptomyces inusitatus]